MKRFFLFIIFALLLSLPGEEIKKSAEEKDYSSLPENLIFGVPAESDLILNRKGFSLGYSKKYRQALWVSYILTAEESTAKKVRRSNAFKVDPAIRYRPVLPKDYKKSGFDKGHLAPAADMSFSVESMKNSFYMSNISPQLPGCNRGIWKRLESKVRLWAQKEEMLCIVTGPVFKKRNRRMKESKLPIPYAFYKVIFDMTPPHKMIGFLIPNDTTKKQLPAFVVSVDQLELLTGFDFFSELEDSLENTLEGRSDFNAWK